MNEIKLNYKEKRLLSESEQSQKDVEYMVKDAKLQFEADILATQRELDTKKAEFEDAKCEYPLNTQDLINLQIEIEALEDGLNRLNKLKEEFGF